MRYDIGTFRTRARVMECQETDGGYAYVQVGSLWCRREQAGLNRVFSRIGLSAQGWDFYARARRLDRKWALRVGEDFYFICDISKPEGGYMTVETAKVTVSDCVGGAEKPEGRFSFPGVFTELYVRHEQEEPMSVNLVDFALVTPKVVHLRPGSLIEARGALYEVLTARGLDGVKNEYTVHRRREL